MGRPFVTATPQDQYFMCEGMQVWMTHIDGKPSLYTPAVRQALQQNVLEIFVCGHSHILRVMYDPQHPPLLYLNPSAAGREGFHKMRTLLHFVIRDQKISHMSAIDLGTSG